MTLRLGEFDVLEPLARGGMGEVWRAVHRGQDLPVAIKVMASDLAEIPLWRERFRTEVRAMARLEHPGVVWVFDYGEVPADVARASGAGLPRGAPWVAMELAGAGTLDERIGQLRWSGLRALLLALLDTLAHAHARNVIHRDLKPANVLLCGVNDLRPGPKLTDFGISAALDDDTTTGDRMLGTPAYMAPEQILSLRSDLGPWTDLYALGCVAWEVATGAPPFDSAERSELLFAHLGSALPEFRPRIAVPAEFLPWLETLLAKAPDRRFTCAADAAHALRALTEPPDEEPLDPTLATLLRATAHSTLPLTRGSGRKAASGGPRATWFEESTLEVATVDLDSGNTTSSDWALPGCPLDWRPMVPERRSRQLQGAGLGLIGLRAVPLAGREVERDALWRLLVDTCAEGTARALVLRGPTGTGKTRLARWLGERASEVGAARYLVARHEVGQTPGEAVAGALRRALRTEDRPRGQRRARIVAQLGEALGDAVAAWLHPEDEPDRTAVSMAERHALAGAVLERLGHERTTVLHLDDVHASTDAIQLAAYLLRRQRVARCAVLVVCTAQDEALAEAPAARSRLDELATLPQVASLRLGPLEGVQRVALVDGLLSLDPEATTALLDRTGGNPLYAVQLVGEWASRGMLVPGRRGFRLTDRDGTSALSLDAMWGPRIDRVLDGLPQGAGVWLERVAVAGDGCSLADPLELARGLRLGVDPVGTVREVVERLCEMRLASEDAGRFSFVHGLVREALHVRARAAGRLPGHHAEIAERLAGRSDSDRVTVGRHLLAAGRPDEAADVLLAGLPDHRHRFGPRASVAACEDAAAALRDAAVGASDPRWGRLALERIAALTGTGDVDEARRIVDRLDEECATHGWPVDLRLGAWLEKAVLRIGSRDFDGAEALLGRVQSDPECTDRFLWRVHYWRYALGEYLNDLDQSRVNGLLACEVLERLGDPQSRFSAAQIRGVLGFMFDDVDEAEPWVAEAVVRADATGSVQSRARALHNLGKVHWYRRRLDQADDALEQSEALYIQAGNVGLGNPRLLRIQVRLVQGRYAEALHLCRDLSDKLGRPEDGVSLRLLELIAHAGMEAWDGFDARFAAVRDDLLARGWCNGEDATALEQLGQLALDQGMVGRARTVWEEALDQWHRHDKREHQEARMRARLAELG